MSLLLSCATCLTPIARLDPRLSRVAPAASYCRGCSGGAQVLGILARG